MTAALTLFDAIAEPDYEPHLSVQERFERFHAHNPHVLVAIERTCDEWVAAGGTRLGMKAVFERLRWETQITTRGSAWKLNNDFASRYSRALCEARPDLAHLFRERILKAA